MPEINHQSLHQYIKETQKSSFAPVYLIYGEDFLCQQTIKRIVDAIIPDIAKQRHGHEIMRQKESGQLVDIVERLNTYAFFNEKKVIELRDSSLFITKNNQEKLIHKIKEKYDNSDLNQALRYYFMLLKSLKIEPDDINEHNIIDILGIDTEKFSDCKWLITLSEESRRSVHHIPDSSDELELLEKAVERGFPRNNHLIISTDTVDKRISFYQIIKKTGVVIDCSVAQGSRKADKDEQRQTIMEYMNRELKKHHKEIDPDAFELMYQKIGFDIRNFSSNLEKLIQYAGDRKSIHIQDAEAISHQVRQDPIYELTGSMLEKNIHKSLYYLSSLLFSGYHPLEILMAITNQIRKLILIKEFLKSSYGIAWHRGIRFDQFQKNVISDIQKYDDALLDHFKGHHYNFWEKAGAETDKHKKDISTDLCLIKKSQHPYSVYMQFTKAEIFEENELYTALKNVSYANAAMKTTGQRQKSILEEVIIDICL